MKIEYESPLFELQRFNFKEIMTGATTTLTSSYGEGGGYQIGDGFGDNSGTDTDSTDWW